MCPADHGLPNSWALGPSYRCKTLYIYIHIYIYINPSEEMASSLPKPSCTAEGNDDGLGNDRVLGRRVAFRLQPAARSN